MSQRKKAAELNKYLEKSFEGKKISGVEKSTVALLNIAKSIKAFSVKAGAKEKSWKAVKKQLSVKKTPSRLSADFGFILAIINSFRTKSLFIKTAAFFTAFLMFTGGLNYASAQSLPKSLLYPVKRVFEELDKAIAIRPYTQAKVRLEHGMRRIREAKKLKHLKQSKNIGGLAAEAKENLLQAKSLISLIGDDIQRDKAENSYIALRKKLAKFIDSEDWKNKKELTRGEKKTEVESEKDVIKEKEKKKEKEPTSADKGDALKNEKSESDSKNKDNKEKETKDNKNEHKEKTETEPTETKEESPSQSD